MPKALIPIFAILGTAYAQTAQQRVQRGSAFLSQNQPDRAIAEFKQAIALDSRVAAAHLWLGQAYLAKGAAEFIAEAKAEFQQARDLEPDSPLASFYIAKIDLDIGRLSSAERELAKSLRVAPGAPHLLALQGEIRRQQGKPAEAVALATKALDTDPNAIPVLYFRALALRDLGDSARAAADLERAIATPFATPGMYSALGSIHLSAGRLDAAESALRKATLYGVQAEPHVRLAQLLRRRNRLSEAMAELRLAEQAPQLSSEYFQKLMAEAAFEKGLILESQRDRAGARAAFQSALEQDPAHEEARKRVSASKQ